MNAYIKSILIILYNSVPGTFFFSWTSVKTHSADISLHLTNVYVGIKWGGSANTTCGLFTGMGQQRQWEFVSYTSTHKYPNFCKVCQKLTEERKPICQRLFFVWPHVLLVVSRSSFLDTFLQKPRAENNGALLTVIARFLLHDGYRAIFMSQKKLLQPSHFVPQVGDFSLEEWGDTQERSVKWPLEQTACQIYKRQVHTDQILQNDFPN